MTTLYLDMDGVVADFDSYAQNAVGATKKTHRWPPEVWRKISSNPRLYRDLAKTSTADELVDYCRKLCLARDWELLFLTAVPKDDDMPWSFYDKVLWATERYPDIPVFFGPHSHDKWKHCKTGDILIDDRPSNCDAWRNAGGFSLLYADNLADTIHALANYESGVMK